MNNIKTIKSPIVPIKSVSNNNLFVKREDLLPFSFGGNKLRIALEFIDDMLHKSCNCLIGYGSSSSNLCRVLTNICNSMNIECHIITPSDNNATSNSSLLKLLGAQIYYCKKTKVADTVDNVINLCKSNGKKPYYIFGNQFGKGNEAIPVNAYVKAYKEILLQSEGMNIDFDYIFLASGTGMTQAGLIAGNAIYGKCKNIVGISIARSQSQEIPILNEYIISYCSKNNIEISSPDINFQDKYICGGYAKYNKFVLETIKREFCINGIPLDTTYTGKAFAGMECYIKENSINNKNILFIHTGGTPLFFNGIEAMKEI